MKPLEGYTVLDFSQYLAGPLAGMRLADLGARVVKVENAGGGDAYRNSDGPTLRFKHGNACFYFANRNKESVSINLTAEDAGEKLAPLIGCADVFLTNFLPEELKSFHLDYDTVRVINPGIVYAAITGFGEKSPLSTPAQDLLVQAMTGATFLNGNEKDGPVPFGIPVADVFSGQFLVQGILAALFRKERTGQGALVQTSMMEAILDIQFENFGAWINGGRQPYIRSNVNGLNACHGAPYGIYATKDGYLALAMGSVVRLGELIGCAALQNYPHPESWYNEQDEIKRLLQAHLRTQATAYWLEILEAADFWCAGVLNWDEMLETEGFQTLNLLQTVQQADGESFVTTRCPIMLDGEYLLNGLPVPIPGQDNNKYVKG